MIDAQGSSRTSHIYLFSRLYHSYYFYSVCAYFVGSNASSHPVRLVGEAKDKVEDADDRILMSMLKSLERPLTGSVVVSSSCSSCC